MSTISVDEVLGALEHDRRDRGGICTTSLNLVAFVENDDALLEWLVTGSEAFAEAHGFRIIVLNASAPANSYSVRTHCKDCGDTLQTSLEHIQLGVQGIGAAQLRSIAHDLLHPNVRNVLMWGGEHLDDDRFTALSDLAHRIILFSSRRTTGLESLREVVRMHDSPIAARIRDLAYMRLMPWQDLTAQFFDDAEMAAELPNLTRVEITAGSAPEAYYLAAWLASRLAWQPCGELDFCNAGGEPVRIAYHQEGLPRRIRDIKLHSRDYAFGIEISPDAEDLICLRVEGRKPRAMRCVPLHDVDVISLVERAIFSPDDGGVYLQTLTLLQRLLQWNAQG